MKTIRIASLHRAFLLASGTLLFFASPSLHAQTFTSGSNGSDGVLDFSGVPKGTTVLFDPTKFNPPLDQDHDNVYHFVSLTVPESVTVRLRGDILPGPVFWLSQGAVTINGILSLNGEIGHGEIRDFGLRRPSIPGSGGYSGGPGGRLSRGDSSQYQRALPGGGPGGGVAQHRVFFNGYGYDGVSRDGNLYQGVRDFGLSTANEFLVPLVGGSGGGGGLASSWNDATDDIINVVFQPGGGAGGGAILIASNSEIRVNGRVTADGGHGGRCCNNQGHFKNAGAGGSIRLVAPTIRGSGILSAYGGYNVGKEQHGQIRLEAFRRDFTGQIQTRYTWSSPFDVFLPPRSVGQPAVRITTVAGVTVVADPTGRVETPDVAFNSSTPVQVTISAQRVPINTVLKLHVFSEQRLDQVLDTSPLVGTFENSSATASLTFPSGFSVGYLRAYWNPQ